MFRRAQRLALAGIIAVLPGVAAAKRLTVVAAPRPQRFYVVSIKQSVSDSEAQVIRTLPGGNLNATNVALPLLLTYAYDVATFQLEGLPNWSRTRFDIVARVDEPEATPDWKGLIRVVLAERFGLSVHMVTKEGDAFQLTAVRRGEPGPSMRSTDADCPVTDVQCGVRLAQGHIEGKSATVSQVVTALTRILRRPVIDSSGLPGRYDFKVDYDASSVNTAAPAASDSPALVTALEDMLGLRLRPTARTNRDVGDRRSSSAYAELNDDMRHCHHERLKH